MYSDHIPQNCPRVAESDREARVESVLAVGLRLPPLTREELFALEPLYLRGSSAEEKAKGPPRGFGDKGGQSMRKPRRNYMVGSAWDAPPLGRALPPRLPGVAEVHSPTPTHKKGAALD